MKKVDNAIQRLEKAESSGAANGADIPELSVLQMLLKINRHYATLMSFDMLFAGIDTVCRCKSTKSP